jgi:DNA-directed RNA polymerase subunit RPC12/RpoP
MTVPVPMDVVGPVTPPPRATTFRCPSCQRKFSTKPELAGKKIRCTRCGAGVRIPGSDQESAGAATPGNSHANPRREHLDAPARPVAGRPVPAERLASADVDQMQPSPLLDELGWVKSTKRHRRAEPVLSSRTELMEQVRQKATEEEAVSSQNKVEKAKKTKKKKRKSSGYFDPKETLTLVAWVSAFVAVLALLAWGYPGTRFPLGAVLCVIGFIVYLLGWTAIRQVVAEEGVLKAMFFRFCPPYQWWYIFTRWDETRDYFAFFLAGAAIMSIGGAIIKTSEEGKRAEASDQAFQKMQKARQPEAAPPALPGGRAF